MTPGATEGNGATNPPETASGSTAQPQQLCAVHLPRLAERSRDVLSLRDVDPTESPYPFGLSLYVKATTPTPTPANATATATATITAATANGDGDGDGDGDSKADGAPPAPSSSEPTSAGTVSDAMTQLPLFYVSAAAASDRWQSSGVRPGWYVVGQPGTRYEVRAHYVSEGRKVTLRTDEETGFSLGLRVDGVDVNDRCMVQAESEAATRRAQLVSWRGFVTGRQGRSFDVRRFEFAKVHVVKDGEVDDINSEHAQPVGEISMYVETAFRVSVVDSNTQLLGQDKYKDKDEDSDVKISEQNASKHGRSIKTASATQQTTFTSEISYVFNKRRLPQAGVTILVRDRAWMESRSIVDENGTAYTYDQFKRKKAAEKAAHNVVAIETDTDVQPELEVKSDIETPENKKRTIFIDLEADIDTKRAKKIEESADELPPRSPGTRVPLSPASPASLVASSPPKSAPPVVDLELEEEKEEKEMDSGRKKSKTGSTSKSPTAKATVVESVDLT